MDYYTDQGIDKKEAMKKVAKDRGMSETRDMLSDAISQGFVDLTRQLKKLCSTWA